jgi:hypothetical protein
MPCVRLTEYGKAISFINNWENLEVTGWMYIHL